MNTRLLAVLVSPSFLLLLLLDTLQSSLRAVYGCCSLSRQCEHRCPMAVGLCPPGVCFGQNTELLCLWQRGCEDAPVAVGYCNQLRFSPSRVSMLIMYFFFKAT